MKKKECIKLLSLAMVAALSFEMPTAVLAGGISENNVVLHAESVSFNEVIQEDGEVVLTLTEEEADKTTKQNVEELARAEAATNVIVIKDKSGTIINNIAIEGSEIGAELNTAIQSATSLASASDIYEITVPAGTYELETMLMVRSNIKLNLTGVTLKKKLNSGLGTMARLGLYDQNFSGYTGTENVTIIGGAFDGQGAADTSEGAALLRFAHGKNITLDGVTILNVKDNHHFETAAIDGLTVKHCTFKGFTATTEGGARKEALQLDIMEETHFPHYANYDKENAPMKNVFITGCTFDTVGRGVGTHSCVAGSYFDNVVIENNTFNNVNEEAIITVHFKNTKIKNNVITNCGNGIVFQTAKPNGQEIMEPLSGTANILTDVDYNSEITNNRITLNPNTTNDNATGIQIHGCILNLFGKKNLNFEAKNIKVTNNTITTSGYGIRALNATGCQIRNNTINYSGKSKEKYNGIMLLDGSSNNWVADNKITKADRMGIYVGSNSNENTIVSNQITDAGIHGMIVTLDSKKNTLDKNEIKNAKENGITISYSSDAVITNNTISGSGKNAIYVQESTVDITNCALTDSKKCAIMLNTKSSAQKIENNTIRNSKENSITLLADSTAKSIADNTIDKGDCGIVVSGGSTKIEKNEINNITKHGIFIKDKAKATIQNNSISNCKKFGIYVAKNCSGSITTNSYSGNKSGNVAVLGSKTLKITDKTKFKIKKASAKKKQAVLKWSADKFAKKYEIYRATSQKGTYKKVKTVNAKTKKYTDKKLTSKKTYYYKMLVQQKNGKVTVKELTSNVLKVKVK